MILKRHLVRTSQRILSRSDPADRLKIGKCNLRLSSDVTSKEATLQVVYDVLKLTPFYKAFQVTADAPEIYMQEFWASAYVHNRSVQFKMNNKKHIIGLDQFRDILQICPKVGNKKFVEPPLEKEILIFLASLGHSGDIRKITDVNVNKLHQPWRSFAAIINKCLSGIPSYDSLRLSQAQILWGTIPPKTKGSKKKANTDTITKQKPPTAPTEKKSGKGKLKTTELETISEAELTEAEQLKIVTKRSRQETHSSHASGSGADEGTGVTPGVPDAPDYDSEDDISWKSSDDDQDDEQAQDDEDADKNDVNETAQDDEDDDDHDDDEKLTTHDDDIIHEEETDEDASFDPTIHTPSRISSSDDEDSDNEVEGANVEGAKTDEDATYEEDQGNEAVEDTNTDLDGRDDVMTDVILPQILVFRIFGQHTEATSLIDTPVTAIMEPSFTAQINRPPTPYPLVIQTQQPPILTPATTTSSLLQNLPNFASLFGFDYRLKALEDNFSELRQTNQYAEALSSIPSTVDQYLANKMQEAVDVAVQLKYDRIREESTTANQQFLDSIDDGMKKIIKEQVKKEVSKIIPKIEKLVTDQLESEVLVRSSKEANTSHAVAANLSELELKKILIDKMKPNTKKTPFPLSTDTYGDTITIKRPRDGADDDQEPSAGTDRGSKRRRSGKEPASTSAPSETTTKTAGKTTGTGSKTHKKSASQSAPVEEAMQTTDVFEAPAHQEFETGVQDEQAEEEVQHLPDWFQQPTRLPSPDHAWNKSVPAVHESVQPWLSNLAQQDPRESFDELTDSTFDFSAFVLNRLNVQTLTPELLAGPTFELMKGTCKSLTERNIFEGVTKTTAADYGHIKWIEDLVPNSMWSQTIVKYDKFALWGISHWGKKRRQFYAFATSRESARDVYSKRRNCYCFIQRRVEDLQLGVESYQKKLNLTKPDTYRSNLRRQDAYTPYSDPRGFIYENKDKKNRLMRIDELHKFSDGTLDDVRTALNDRLKGIRMEYLPQTFWSQRDKANARAMIQAIDKRLKTRRIMRSLERFVGGRPYGGDLRLLQRTI
ncbi:hypothetical protein Tco_0336074 [Tanacetum coccineum]